ncbi:VOC family protein [Roseobacter sp. YSTF-M11]|uniref:VOC family protein n=1 Tax=Roseobacter insulae TaxID=2859783 RepID=A0A9X1K002_9RHOB|nr:VOC family protein [Roseobacter insulae]MBW4709951.1 VOC family protein [Roseobacter insulae]
MKIGKLDHVNLRTDQLDAMIAWYRDILGLTQGARPDFAFPGAWMYADDTAAVHLVSVESEDRVGAERDLKLEHFAFSATGAAEFEARLQSHGQQYKRNEIAAINIVQFNVWDPDGNHVHIDFLLDE